MVNWAVDSFVLGRVSLYPLSHCLRQRNDAMGYYPLPKVILVIRRLTIHQFVHPVAFTVVVAMQTDFIIPSHQRVIGIFRRFFDRLA